MSDARGILGEEVLFHRWFSRPGTVVDLGAHTGDFIVELLDIPGLSFVAIEPLHWAVERLRQRVSTLSRPIRIIDSAISDHFGLATLSVPTLDHGGPVWPWASLVKNFDALRQEHPEISSVQAFEVKLETLDSLSLRNVTALKVDAEGAEYEVLRGARKLLSDMKPIVSVELEERHRAGCTYTVPAFMDALGFECFFKLRGKFQPVSNFDRVTMQRASASPASHDYSEPYVGCFYFLPRSIPELFRLLDM